MVPVPVISTPVLRPFQVELKGDVHQAWNQGAQNVLMRLDTGGGKTVTLADILREANCAACVIAHRQELVAQLSLTLAKYGVRHNLIAAEATKRNIARLHVETFGYSLYDPGSRVIVASVDTLVRQELDPRWTRDVRLWVVDEGHHLVVGNKWHTAIAQFTHPLCRGLLPSATPRRADGKGLGRGTEAVPNDGVADVMVQGPPMRWLIDQGYLTDYRVVCPPSDLQMLVDVSASGDWSSKQLREAAKRSHIVGDVVAAYLHYARGRLGITFSTDVETAVEQTNAYRLAGVRAETLTGKTDDYVRRAILRQFEARQIDQIVAVDIISEGFDLPAIEVASMARPTASLALYMQQFGRTLRTMPGKQKALILDHAANIIRHQGPPDKPRPWSLLRAGSVRSGPSDAIPLVVCVGPATVAHPLGGCFEPYEKTNRECPHCGYYMEPSSRATPKAVAGDMQELSPDVLAKLREAVDEANMTTGEKRGQLMKMGIPHVGFARAVSAHEDMQEAQGLLRSVMMREAGWWHAEGMSDAQIQRRFYLTYGVDVLTAQALRAKDARELADKIIRRLPG